LSSEDITMRTRSTLTVAILLAVGALFGWLASADCEEVKPKLIGARLAVGVKPARACYELQQNSGAALWSIRRLNAT
jgi:hypothetical protein